MLANSLDGVNDGSRLAFHLFLRERKDIGVESGGSLARVGDSIRRGSLLSHDDFGKSGDLEVLRLDKIVVQSTKLVLM